MKVQEAIKTIETLKGWEFWGRQQHYNLDTNRTETAYLFDGACFDCLGELRFYAEQIAYTHGVR